MCNTQIEFLPKTWNRGNLNSAQRWNGVTVLQKNWEQKKKCLWVSFDLEKVVND